jgi:diphosphomevalonate decarboxylase
MIKSESHANIALIKYWGKRDSSRFLPTKSSISVSAPGLITKTTVEKNNKNFDEIFIEVQPPAGGCTCFHEDPKVTRFLELFRHKYKIKDYFIVKSQNSFPVSAGLASSASGFAALAKCLNELYKLDLSLKELSILARQGSGSACRSIYSGFVIWHKGEKPDGSDSYAEKLFDLDYWPEFRIIPIILSDKKKKICSRKAMKQTVLTSPLYEKWVKKSQARIKPMIEAIRKKDIHAVGQLAEDDALEMHECIRSATPSIGYFLPETYKTIERVKKLRETGVPCYATIDAGPNVKIITLEKYRKVKKNVASYS